MNNLQKKPGYENTQMSKTLPASNIYRVGDYVFVETQPSHPYQIRRIEELTKTTDGKQQVEAKVSCFYRRRDLSNPLVSQADKHAVSAEEEGEINIGNENVLEEQGHQLKHREVFLSRQLEIINANTIRGKCSVTLYSEVEHLLDYIEKDDWFYYLLVYDPQQKTLLADRGEIDIGADYQATVPETTTDPSERKAECSDYETLVWDPNNALSTKQVDQFLICARSVGTFARALDSGSGVKEPSLHLTAAAASRDITLMQAMHALHKTDYDLGAAISSLIPDGGPILCRDEMEEFSSGESTLFEEGVKRHGKEFLEIQQEYLPWKRVSSLIEYFYMWKTTDKYVQQKRLKAAEGEHKVTQIFIPSSNTAINLTLAIQASSQYQVTSTGNLVTSNFMCEGCFNKESVLWYPWGPSSAQCKLYLCKDCWVYWKKCGGLRKPNKSGDSENALAEPQYKCRICNKKFNRAERLSSHMTTHRGYDCTEQGCGKTFTLKTHLSRHLAKQHSIYSTDSKTQVKTPFLMTSTPLCKATRYLCRSQMRLKHFARTPTEGIDNAEVLTNAHASVTAERAQRVQQLTTEYKPLPLEDIVERVRKLPLPVQRPQADGADDHVATRPGMPINATFQQAPASITQSLKAKSLKSPTPIMQQTGQKRTATAAAASEYTDSGEPPSSKRQAPLQQAPLSGSSPLGRKGYECNMCGKMLHNQMSLQHHVAMHHGTGGPPMHGHGQQAQDAHKQQHYSRGGYQQQHEHHQPAPPHSQYPPQHAPPGYHHKDGERQAPSAQASHSKHRSGAGSGGGTSRKQAYKGIVQQRGAIGSRDQDQQYVDPPQEFLFTATKDSKKSRRSLPPRVQRKIARKPFVQIKCSQELRDAIMCQKNAPGLTPGTTTTAAAAGGPPPPVTKKADPIVIDDD